MTKTTNTVPYTNAARAGRTHHGLIEMRDDRTTHQPPSNRAYRRARGVYRGATRRGVRTAPSLRSLGLHPSQKQAA